MRARRFGVRIPAGHNIFLFSTTFILVLGPAQPPIIVLLLLLLLLLLCGGEGSNLRSVPRALPFMFKIPCPIQCFVECFANISRFLIQVLPISAPQ